MAQIPRGENLGYRVPEPQRAVQVPAGAFGEGVAREVGAAAGVALDRMEVEARRKEAEERQAQKEAEAQRKAAERAKANEVMLMAGDELQLLHDDVAENVKTGKIPKDQVDAEWSRRSGEQLTAAMETVPQEHREIVQARLRHRVSVLSRGVRKAVQARDQTDTLASLNNTLESTSRMYLKDPAQAQAITDKTLEELGPAAGLTTEQIRAKSQQWRETTRFTTASAMVGAARRDNRALEAVAQRLNGPEFADLDPQRKLTLQNQIVGFQTSNEQRAEVAARRAEAAAQRRLNEAEATFNAARSIFQEGKILNDDYVQQAAQKVAGTPYAAAFGAMLQAGRETASLGAQPIPVMDRTINDLRARLNASGTDPKTEKALKDLEQVRDAAKRDYAQDPLPAALERGVIERIAPLDVSNMANVTAGLAARVEQAQIVATRVGQPVSPLLQTEAEQVAKLIMNLPVEQRASAIADLSTAAGPQVAGAISRQIAAKDKALGIAFGLAGAKTTQGRHTSELVLRGAQAVKDRSINLENQSVVGIRAQVAAEIGDAVSGTARDTLIDAAVLTYYGLQSEGSANVGQAIRLATGGVTERGGRKVVLPYGVPEADFDKRVRSVTGQTLAGQLPDGKVYVDGKAMDAAAFAATLPDAGLLTVGNGRYHVRAGRSVATNKDGRPLVLEVK